MVALAGMEKAQRSQSLVVAKAALRGMGAVEAGGGGKTVKTAGTGRATSAARTSGVRVRKMRVRKMHLKV